MVEYPANLPRGLHSGRSFQVVSPLVRTALDSGRARQRRRFTSTPENVSVSWIFTSVQGVAFEAWWRDALIDGSQWFLMPLDHPLGYRNYTARFIDVYSGPVRVATDLWSYTADMELIERAAAPVGSGLFPDFILQAAILDVAVNSYWPLHRWDSRYNVLDNALNSEWPEG